MNIPEIKEIISLFENSSLSLLKLEDRDMKIELAKDGAAKVESAAAAVEPGQSRASVSEAVGKSTQVKAPLPGVFYRGSSPQTPPYVEVGQKVNKGDTLCLVEAMKVMNEIPSPVAGTVAAILVENEELVSFDQILLEIKE
ncbi:MAG: acetyl-CoA carboxylase biotin carboxyl carrier protein [Bacillota bacterium]|nr:acetyl-CoA carboxylase biotin carboxyl carrier protein [Bacillota bacterium]